MLRPYNSGLSPEVLPRALVQPQCSDRACAAALLVVGGGLFFQFETVRSQWPWVITPFNALFVGAIFIAGAAVMALLAWYGRWAAAR